MTHQLVKMSPNWRPLILSTAVTPTGHLIAFPSSGLGREPLQYSKRVYRLSTSFKIQHGLVELYTDVVRQGDKRTRGQHILNQPASKLSIYNNSFFPRTIREWNLLPRVVTDATTIEEFRVGQHILYQPAAKLSINKNSFFSRTIREWKLLPTTVTDATTIKEFRVSLGHALPAF